MATQPRHAPAQPLASRRRLFGLPAPVGAAAVQEAGASAAGVDAAGADQPEPDARTAAAALSAQPVDIEALLAALSTPAIWVDSDDRVHWSHPSLESLRVVRRGSINVAEIAKMLGRARGTGQTLDRAVTVRRPGRRQAGVRLRVRVAPMSAGAVLVLVEDVTEAERLDHARRDFVANVSHELKTPIGALSLLAEALQQAQGDPEASTRFSDRMLIETHRLATLITDLMDLSRLEGVEPMQPTAPVSIDEVVAQACDDARALAQAKDIAFLRGGVADLHIEGVATQLVTAVRNLIVNAINYSPPATKVAVSTGTGEGHVTIAVTDQGIGIPAPELGRIFERFYRVDPARSRDTGGTGLGLAIVKHVCANHGGDCEVWSKVGEGSSFTIRLPVGAPRSRSRSAGSRSRARSTSIEEEQ
ncbi:MAG: ATP-binding protein [Candidatus Nanopelagicales bacterium]